MRFAVRDGAALRAHGAGRRSGKPRSTPVPPLTVGGRTYVVAGPPDSDRARSVRAAGSGRLSPGRRRETVALTEVTDRAPKEQVMRAYPREVPKGAVSYRGGDGPMREALSPDTATERTDPCQRHRIRPHCASAQGTPSLIT
ncbi:hypothetical protein Val02_29880 [Virgisporangium aliadipatigenens]|uniref:Uncharacterized protein n=1 Tax=Virgisporangium aliadipatigenens TaxID=741659 RepID=A0A8J3YKQ8_9ACTN|nr:hypothetical protein Val02_29880 [Virgisporangium aliadipatigenens]